MQHQGFFQREGPYLLKVIAEATGAELVDLCDGEKEIDDLRPLYQAAETHLTFCTSRKYAGQLAETHAAACLIKHCDADLVPERAAAVMTDAPHRAFAIAVGLLYPEALQPTATGAAANAAGELIHRTAEIAEGVEIEPGAVIGREARIGAGTTIAAGAVVGYRVFIGPNCYVGPGAAVTHAVIG
ncbi:MAG TPA: LpxD N-terminal domain-containing protein [Methyloceanibacter sp.]|jgi:UDP-3-O-[3-hydroxymyristoyl] glucosamine N-acyltransferase|nr:LpxD N-terminal domain-containing protein [Methyloceanibacter sp.]